MRLVHPRILAGVLALGLSLAAGAAPIAHVAQAENALNAFIFDWQSGGRATVVTNDGRRGANFTASGAQRIATLDVPLSREGYVIDPDCPGTQYRQRNDVLQIAVTRTSGTEGRGTSAVTYLGTITMLEGCNAGRVVPYGSLTDPGLPTQHLAMALRPSLADLVPGVAIAGPSDAPAPVNSFPAADVMTVQAGSARFATSGSELPLTTVDGWMVLGLASGERGYTRFAVDRRTGNETWIGADWSGGLPERLIKVRMVKPEAGAGFGTVRQASRMWESIFSVGSNTPFFFYLYRDGTGERVTQDLALGTETRQPVLWGFEGANIVTTRSLGDGSVIRRTWVPLRNSGAQRFVMEDEVRLPVGGGAPLPSISRRVNVYTDTGPATPPAP